MRALFTALAVAGALAVAACGSGGGAGGSSVAVSGAGPAAGSGRTVTLTFESLAFQAPTVAAVKQIVSTWNSAHPDIQVTLQQGDPGAAGDQYTTQLNGGTAPDVIDFQSSLITDFIKQGFLADIGQWIDPQIKSSIPDAIWNTVTVDGKVYAAPTLLQSYVVFANTDQLAAAGVPVPTGRTLSWDDFQALAQKLTTGGHAGLGWGLKSPAATVLNLGLGFGGTFFSGRPEQPTFAVGDNEMQVPQRIKKMLTARNLDATSVTQGGSDTLPGFFAGKYAMVVGGDYIAQTIKNSAPANFHWTVLPALAGSSSANQAADPQTLSVTSQSSHQQEAAEFINYYLQAKNLASVGQGDWLIPSSQGARDEILARTKGADGWTNILATATDLVPASFTTAAGYPKWKTQTAIPSLQKYFAGSLDDNGLKDALTRGWQAVGS